MDRSQDDINLFWLHVKFFSQNSRQRSCHPWPISKKGTTNPIRLSVPIRSQSHNSFALSLELLRIRGELELQPGNRPPVNNSEECKKARLVRLIKPPVLEIPQPDELPSGSGDRFRSDRYCSSLDQSLHQWAVCCHEARPLQPSTGLIGNTHTGGPAPPAKLFAPHAIHFLPVLRWL